MPTQRVLEGPDLEQLLADARAEHGPDVAIVEANKVRTGGIGGFFAREGFEVVIEVDEDPAPRGASAASRREASILGLVDAVDDGPEPQFYDVEKLGDLDDHRRGTRRGDRPLGVGSASAAALLEAVADQRARGEAPLTPGAATVSTDGAAFAEVLDRFAGATADSTRSARPQGAAAAPADDSFRPFTDRGLGGDDDRPAGPTASGRVLRTNPRPGTARRPTPAADATPTPAPTRDGAVVPARGRRAARTSEQVLAGREPVQLDVDGLVRLGLPEPYLAEPGTARDRMSALIELARRFPEPEPLPLVRDAVIVLVGDRHGMQDAIGWVQETLRVDGASMVVATRRDARALARPRRIDTAEDAVIQRRNLRRRPDPTVVVVDEPIGRRGLSWARDVLEALEPTVVWGAVEAHRKPEDVIDWCERLGGVDAVAVHGIEETASPGSILATGLPVSLIDGRPATPVRWAAVLDERLRAA